MNLSIEDELLARSIGFEIVHYINHQNLLDKCVSELNSDAIRVLEQIRCILDDETLKDPECFAQIERIVQAFYASGISTARHD